MKETLLSIIIESLAVIFLAVVFGLVISEIAFADKYHHKPTVTYLTPVYEKHEINVNLTDEQMAAIEAINSYSYTPDTCSGVAEAQAAANNQMYMGTKALQMSLGGGVCSESWATSLQMGMRVNNRMMITGSWGHNYRNSTNSAGAGLHLLFK